MSKNLCIYCSSSERLDDKYYQFGEEFGARIVQEGYEMVYGGTTVGIMGAVAGSVLKNHGKVVGVVPKGIFDSLQHFEQAGVIVTDDMRTRKEKMEKLADAFVALPGGFGTLEEVFEIIVRKQLGYHSKAIVFMNFNEFYDGLLEMFDKIYEEKFAKHWMQNLYFIANTVDEVFTYLDNYVEIPIERKWD